MQNREVEAPSFVLIIVADYAFIFRAHKPGGDGEQEDIGEGAVWAEEMGRGLGGVREKLGGTRTQAFLEGTFAS